MNDLELYEKALDIVCTDHWGCPPDCTDKCKGHTVSDLKWLDCKGCWKSYYLREAKKQGAING